MTAPGQVTVLIGDTPVITDPTRTTPDVVTAYENQLNIIIQIFSKTSSTDADANALVAAYNALKAQGVGGGFTTEMAKSVDLIGKSIDLAKIGTGGAINASMVTRWRDLGGIGLTELLKAALGATYKDRSLQAMIELDYVKQGNDIIFDALGKVQQALSATKDILDTLNTIQSLHNMVVAPNPSPTALVDQLKGVNFDSIDSFMSTYSGITEGRNKWEAYAIALARSQYAGVTSETSGFLTYAQRQDLYKILFPPETAGIGAGAGSIYLPKGSTPPAYTAGTALNLTFTFTYDNLTPGQQRQFVNYLDQVKNGGPHTIPDPAGGPPIFASEPNWPGYLNPAAPTAKINPYVSGVSWGTVNDLLNAKAALKKNLDDLQKVNFISPRNLEETPPVFPPGTLQANIQAVLNDLAPITESGDAGVIQVTAWLLDKMGTTDAGVGDIQRHISSAITTAQSLNDTQKEDVRKNMFLFEEFYKSATALLQRITQLIEKMAQSIKG